MGSSTVDFRDLSYVASDGGLEVWLHFLVVEIDQLSPLSPWLQEVRDEWQLQSTAGFGFGVTPALDRLITTEAQRATVLQLSERALAALERQGPVMSQNTLNALELGGEDTIYLYDVPTEVFLRVGRYFSKLLQGTLTAEEGDARIYNWRK